MTGREADRPPHSDYLDGRKPGMYPTWRAAARGLGVAALLVAAIVVVLTLAALGLVAILTR